MGTGTGALVRGAAEPGAVNLAGTNGTPGTVLEKVRESQRTGLSSDGFVARALQHYATTPLVPIFFITDESY